MQALSTLRPHRGTVAIPLGVLLVVRLTSQESAPPHNSSVSAAVVEVTTQPTTGAARSGKRPRRRLPGGRQLLAIKWEVHPAPPSSRRRSVRNQPPNRRAWDLAGTM
jgi:hypothetical protein